MGGKSTTVSYYYGMSEEEKRRFHQMQVDYGIAATEVTKLSVAKKYLEQEIREAANEKQEKQGNLHKLQNELMKVTMELSSKIKDQRTALFESKLEHTIETTLEKCEKERLEIEEKYSKEMEEEAKEVKKEAGEMEENLEEIEEEARRMKKKTVILKASKEGLAQQRQELKDEIEKYEEQTSKAEADLFVTRKEILETEGQIDLLKDEVERATKTNEGLRKARDEWEKKYKYDLQIFEEKVSELQERIKQLEEESYQKLQEIIAARDKNAKLQAENNRVSKEIKEMQEKHCLTIEDIHRLMAENNVQKIPENEPDNDVQSIS